MYTHVQKVILQPVVYAPETVSFFFRAMSVSILLAFGCLGSRTSRESIAGVAGDFGCEIVV